jgi:hypothetical protein
MMSGLGLMFRALRCRLLHQTDVARWKKASDFPAEWQSRTRRLADAIPKDSRVIEFGCGQRLLEQHLGPSCAYLGCDLVDRGPATLICDLNVRPLPVLHDLNPDVAVFAGVMEYIADLPSVVQWITQTVNICIASYNCMLAAPPSFRWIGEIASRTAAGWVNHYSEAELCALFSTYRFKLDKKLKWGNASPGEAIYVFSNEVGGGETASGEPRESEKG